MVKISDEAYELLLVKLQEALEGRPELRRRPVPIGLKLFMKKNRAHLSLGFPSEGDKVVSYQGRSVLIISPQDMDALSEACFLVRRCGTEYQLAVERGIAGE